MPPFASLTLLVAPFAAAVFFYLCGATPRNLAAAIVVEWLLLPLGSIKLSPGIPGYDKAMAVAVTLLLGILIWRPELLLKYRPHWIDGAMFLWCLMPLCSSLSNGLGLKDGVYGCIGQCAVWGVPWFFGRLLSDDTAFLVAFGKALLVGAVAYAPLILLESRLAPQLHSWVYGVYGRSNWEQVDFFGPLRWKPTVFLQSQLELTPMMGIATLFGFWLWRAGNLKTLGRVAMGWLVPIAAMSTILGKSLGGFCLTVAGVGILLLTRRCGSIIFLLILSVVAPVYITTRTLGWWSGQQVVAFLKDDVSQRRAQSFEFRLHNEDMLIAKALEQPLLGWAGWGRSGITDEYGRLVSIWDGMWIIVLGSNGIVGLSALYLALLLPVWLIALRADRALIWEDPRGSIVLVAAVAVVLHSIDFLVNAMPNPVYLLLAGGLASVAIHRSAPAAARQKWKVSVSQPHAAAVSPGFPA